MIKKNIVSLTRKEMKNHIISLQQFIQNEQAKGKDIDQILDETDIFDEFEEILPDNEFPIFVITVLNGFQSDVILENLLDTLDSSINGK